MHTRSRIASAVTAGLALGATGLATALGAPAAPVAAAPQPAPVAAAVTGGSAAPSSQHVRFNLNVSTPQLAKCFPHAKANVRVKLTTDRLGKDTFDISTSGLRPKTAFTVFLLEKPTPKFGAAEYIGDFTTDKHGRGHGRFKLIVEEAFALNAETGTRQDLNSVGFWFADEADDDGCLGAASPVTPFDGDGAAGVQMMNSGVVTLP